MVDEATLQVQLDAELNAHLTAARGRGHQGIPRRAARGGRAQCSGRRAGSADPAASPPRARLIDSAAAHPHCRRVLSGHRRPYIPDNAGRAGEKGDGGAMQTLRQ
jgi:hypothetical protein